MAKQPWQIYGDFAVADVGGSIVVVSASDVSIVESHRWYLLKRCKNLYAATGQGILMHRLLLGLQSGDGNCVDHRDNFGLNNWRENLRVGTQGQNRANSRKLKPAQSKYKGARRAGTKWSANVGPKKGRIYLGVFETEEAAARAYDAKALELYGTFARLNFPQTQQQEAA